MTTKNIVLLFISSFLFFPVIAKENDVKLSSQLPSLSIYHLESVWTNQNKQTISLSELGGKPAIIALTYTSCPYACPIILKDIKIIQEKLEKNGQKNFLFYLFSFDTARDSPDHLRKFAQKKNLRNKNWMFFNGDETAVQELANVLNVRYKKDKYGNYSHSNVITLLDKDGQIIFQQIGLNSDPLTLLNEAFKLK